MLCIDCLRLLVQDYWHNNFVPIFLVVLLFVFINLLFLLIIKRDRLVIPCTRDSYKALFNTFVNEVWLLDIVFVAERCDLLHQLRLPIGPWSHDLGHLTRFHLLIDSDSLTSLLVILGHILIFNANLFPKVWLP